MEPLTGIRADVQAELRSCHVISELAQGRLDLDQYRSYLANAWHYAQHSSEFMAVGAARCVPRHPALARYLLHHADEELGHDAWAEADLADLGVAPEDLRASRPVPSCAALIGYVHWLAHAANPVALFGWMYVLEAVGDDLGQAAAEGLRTELPVGSAVRFVAGHAVSDVGHTADIEAQLTAHVNDPDDRADVVAAAEVVAHLYTRMFREIGAERPAWT